MHGKNARESAPQVSWNARITKYAGLISFGISVCKRPGAYPRFAIVEGSPASPMTRIKASATAHKPAATRALGKYSELKFKLGAEFTRDGVEEAAQARRKDVLLDVARVEVVRDIENLQPGDHLVLLLQDGNLERPPDLQVEREEHGEAPGGVARADKVQVVVHVGEGEAGVDVEHGRSLDLPWQADHAPQQEAVRRVVRQQAA